MKKILLLLTGGTICSFGDENNRNRETNMERAERLIVSNFRASGSAFADREFETVQVLNVLSENMTVAHWNTLIEYLKGVSVREYAGIIIAHGTDTLAYTASLLATVLQGITCPVILVSSQLPLDCPDANGNENFAKSVELIDTGLTAGVYAVYRNTDGRTYLHYGDHLKQCAPYSEDFYSCDMREVSVGGAATEKTSVEEHFAKEAAASQAEGSSVLSSVGALEDTVLLIHPYVGLNYDRIRLEGIKAIVHETYHSETACADGEGNSSLVSLLKRCESVDVPVFLTPMESGDGIYVTANRMQEAGGVPVFGETTECVYARCVVGLAMGLTGRELCSFVRGMS